MSKLTLVLALYAAAVATYGFVTTSQNEDRAESRLDSGSGAISAVAARDVVTRARREAREEIQPKLRELEAWKGRIESIRAEMQDELSDLDQWIEETAQLSAGGLDDLKVRLQAFEGIGPRLDAIAKDMEALSKRVKAVEDRPAVIREVATAGPAKPVEPVGPRVPTLPDEVVEDPAEIAAKVEKAVAGLQEKNTTRLWAAINTVRKYKVLEAAPRLIELLREHKNPLLKKASAQALGAMRACDAVIPLADAMVSNDDSLGQVANQAVKDITGYESGMADGAKIKARRRAKNAVHAWWRTNEASVRERLGQPKDA